MVQIKVSLTKYGIERVIAHGNTAADRAEAISVLRRIEPGLAAIDRELEKK